MTTAPTLNGQVIGQAHYATRALLDRALDGTGISFHQSVILNLASQQDGGADRAAVIRRATGTLRITDAETLAAIAAVAEAGLLTEEGEDGGEVRLVLTEAGQAQNSAIRAAVADISTRMYGDFPAEELATAARVLNAVTDRANAELDGP
jgi:DNA-binding MarR family transcriptional regulator